ncbi:MAG: ISNCY family transposase [Candidatus Brocadia sp. UTAMX2]|nr:MAG: ISNCY family transposase [Candidatus Brocadia sp. UTAMX2]
MRKRFEQQLKLGIIPISGEHIYVTPELNEEVFRILEGKVLKGKKKTGRYGMDLWQILVLSTVRLGLDADYDRLDNFANHHKLIRQIVGVETTCGEGKRFSRQSIKDNVSLLDEETITRINEVVVRAGHKLVKKKGEGLRIKADTYVTYVLESDVHFPTDVNLLWDAARKSLDVIEDAVQEGLLEGKGWRKGKYWRRELKTLMRSSAKALFGGGKHKEETTKERVKRYLGLARGLSEKIEASTLAVYGRVLSINQVAVCRVKLERLEYFHRMLKKHIDLVERRVIKGEQIPVEEKGYSLFETHTEWLYKGKANKKVELGHNILVASDQWGFIVEHQVVESQAEVSLSIPLADRLLNRFGDDAIESISFDKGFYKRENKELLSLYIPEVIMPKKGKKSQSGQTEESGRTFKKLTRHSQFASKKVYFWARVAWKALQFKG